MGTTDTFATTAAPPATDLRTEGALAALIAGLLDQDERRLTRRIGLLVCGNIELNLDSAGMAINLRKPKKDIGISQDTTAYLDPDELRTLARILARAADAIGPPVA
jgi:hypothetical protein